jgi:hypothetical protein
MSRVALSIPLAVLCVGLVAGIPSAQARWLGQAGAVDPSTFYTGGPESTNATRPTLVLPERLPASAATDPTSVIATLGWSRLNGPLYQQPRAAADQPPVAG